MARQKIVIPVLIPPAWLYGLAQLTRNALYDSGLLKQVKHPLNTIVVGNIVAGGTGKTPHVAWLAELLSADHNVAILSRGYKRKSRGFRWVSIDDHPDMSGDEPLELKRALPHIPVAVDADRLRGLDRMAAELSPAPDYVILDDGFQHRRLKAGFSIILSHYDWPLFEDYLLPAGRLREPVMALKRADALILTGAPPMPGIENYRRKLRLDDSMPVFSSSFRPGKFVAITKEAEQSKMEDTVSILCISGIAGTLALDTENESKVVCRISYPDHHRYSEKNIISIKKEFEKIPGERKIIVTTGKDAVKLANYREINKLPVFMFTREIVMEPGQVKSLISRITKDG